MRGGYRAVFTDAAIESSWTAGWDGRPTTTLTEYTEQGSREVDLSARDAYAPELLFLPVAAPWLALVRRSTT
jgi:hypothetical protein